MQKVNKHTIEDLGEYIILCLKELKKQGTTKVPLSKIYKMLVEKGLLFREDELKIEMDDLYCRVKIVDIVCIHPELTYILK
ncbi:hypothetical protein AYK26_00745 [Euryarchaeota archaeon SM23-78]|nr:MAG: hypothetical protein AYK26_00745 [Euryarchaeota archaeon SM23-78]